MKGFKIKRIYEAASDDDGYRILVDRLWPRGVSKIDAQLNEWNKEVAPSTELRKWFNHNSGLFDEFAKLYRKELSAKKDELKRLKELSKKIQISLLYGAKDPQNNHAVILKNFLLK